MIFDTDSIPYLFGALEVAREDNTPDEDPDTYCTKCAGYGQDMATGVECPACHGMGIAE